MQHCLPFGHERPTLCHSRQSSLFNQWQRTYSTVILPSIKRNMEAQADFFFSLSLPTHSNWPHRITHWPGQRWSSCCCSFCCWCVVPNVCVCEAKQLFKLRISPQMWVCAGFFFPPELFFYMIHDTVRQWGEFRQAAVALTLAPLTVSCMNVGDPQFAFTVQCRRLQFVLYEISKGRL